MSKKIDWDKIKSTDQKSVDLEAARERESLGIDVGRLKFSRAYNSEIPDIKELRQRLGLSQSEFAARFRISRRTIQEWEQGRSLPDQPARILLRIIALAPEIAAHAASGCSLGQEKFIVRIPTLVSRRFRRHLKPYLIAVGEGLRYPFDVVRKNGVMPDRNRDKDFSSR